MIRRAIHFGCVLLLVCGALTLSSCFAWLNPEPQTPSLFIVSQPFHLSSGLWEVTVSVKGLSDGGIAGVLFGNQGITPSGIDKSSIVASGLNGFIVTAQDFDDPSPQGTLVAIHPSAGITDGKILKFIFRSLDDNPRLSFDESKVTVLKDQATSPNQCSGM
jgi:hypothetical protein